MPAAGEVKRQLHLDGIELTAETVPLVDDQREHFVEFKMS
jgi:hypothetical protein